MDPPQGCSEGPPSVGEEFLCVICEESSEEEESASDDDISLGEVQPKVLENRSGKVFFSQRYWNGSRPPVSARGVASAAFRLAAAPAASPQR